MKEEVLVSLHHFFQIVFADRFLCGRVLFLEALLQNLGRGLQIDHEVGSGQLLAEVIVITIVGLEFLIVQIQAGKNLIFFEYEIGNDGLLRAPAQIESAQLLESSHQKCELCLEGRSRLSVIEWPQKSVSFGIREALGMQTVGEDACKRTLADSYGTFY